MYLRPLRGSEVNDVDATAHTDGVGGVAEKVRETAPGQVEEETKVHLTELVELGNVCVLETVDETGCFGERQTGVGHVHVCHVRP